jgi:glycosyltransferase involved in cell wall biosynthesis
MNIGMVVHYFDRSEGTGGYVVELLNRIAQHHQVTLYAAGIRASVPSGVEIVRVPALRGRAYATILSFPAAFALVRRRHDIVHTQGWVAGHADVVTAHIVLAAWQKQARISGVRSSAGERWMGGFVTRREAALYGNPNRSRIVIAPSRKARADLASFYGRRQEVHVVPHGFPAQPASSTQAEARRFLGLPEESPVALYVGDARKGLATAIEAIARAASVIHLLVLSGSAAASYLSLARRHGVERRIHWMGHVTDPLRAYAAADVLLHPTIYDTFGMVVAEAMAMGLPPIVSRAAGVTELIEHGVSGWLIGGGVEEAHAALETVLGNAQLRTRLAAGARLAAERRSWDDVAQETMAVYHHALNGGSTSARLSGTDGT